MAESNLILDTGPLVALLHADDEHHDECRIFFKDYRGALFTTEPVLTEAVYLLQDVDRGASSVLDFFLRGSAILVPQSRMSLLRSKTLMEQYSNIPMDLADATLVSLAEEMEIYRVFTLDRRGFSVFRAKNKKHFQIVP